MDEIFANQQPGPAEKKRNDKPYGATIIVTSDTCCKDELQDLSGIYVKEQLSRNQELFSRVTKHCVEDDAATIKDCLKRCLQDEDPALVITIGGTGLTPRDVTADAVSSLYEKHCTGIVVALHMMSLRYSPHAALSRLTAGIIGECLVVNFPGSPKACKDCLTYLDSFIEHALEQVRFNAKAYNDTHLRLQGVALSLNDLSDESRKSSAQLAKTPVSTLLAAFGSENSLRERLVDTDSSKGDTSSKASLVDLKSNTNSPANKLDRQISRLSIREVQKSRAEQQLVKDGFVQSKPVQNATKKTFYYKNKFTSRDNLSQKRPTGAKIQEKKIVSQVPQVPQVPLVPLVPLMPITKVPATHSSYPIIEFTVAQEILGALSGDLLHDHEEVVLGTFEPAFKLIGRVLKEGLSSQKLVPPHAVSTMDGFVVHIPPKLRKVTGTITQLPPYKIVDGLEQFLTKQVGPQDAQTFFCYRVNTGGKLPRKNFAVVPVEKTGEVTSDGFVPIYEIKRGQYQREAGSDLSLSDSLPRGTVIGPIELSLIISMGHKKVDVFRQPRIGVLSTGDEIVNFFSDREIGPDQVADTNGPLLSSIFRLRGYFSFNCGIVKDEPNEILRAIHEALKKCEVLIVTGGASMGSKDHVKDVIKHMGGSIHFGRVNIKPGKPAAFATLFVENRRKFIFSLPGNPVSAYITSMLLVLPFIEHGTKHHFSREGTLSLDCVGEFINVTVAEIIDEPYEFDGRLEFIRAKIISKGPDYRVRVCMRQQSSRLLSLKDYNCLIMIHQSKKGERLTVDVSYPALKVNRPL